MAPQYVLLLIVIVGVAVAIAIMEARHPRTIGTYWQRSCAGLSWKRTFPDASKHQVREFLFEFVDSFAFARSRALVFSTTDRLQDIYRALYPIKGWPDALELESFAIRLQERYNIDLGSIWRDNLTLGELFARTRSAVP